MSATVSIHPLCPSSTWFVGIGLRPRRSYNSKPPQFCYFCISCVMYSRVLTKRNENNGPVARSSCKPWERSSGVMTQAPPCIPRHCHQALGHQTRRSRTSGSQDRTSQSARRFGRGTEVVMTAAKVFNPFTSTSIISTPSSHFTRINW